MSELDVERLRIRINIAADDRETRPVAPLGRGYYTLDQRERATALAASMLAAAEEHGVTLDDLDIATDLAIGALDVIPAVDRRARRLAGA